MIVAQRNRMDTRQIIDSLKAERDRLNKAIAALEETTTHFRPGRQKPGRIGKRRLSAAARKKISQAAKARWAKAKKAGRNRL